MINFSDGVEAKIENYLKDAYKNVAAGEKQFESFVKSALSENNSVTQIKWLRDNVGLSKEHVALDYGSGTANLVVTGNIDGYKFRGFEVDERLYDIGRTLCAGNGVDPDSISFETHGMLPYEDNTFDLVSSFFVYEHVMDTRTYLEQGVRVLKKGGKFVIFTCNYQLMYEFHYGLFLPLFSKVFTKFILRVLGRNPEFIDGINMVTPDKFLKNIGELHGVDIKTDNIGIREYVPNLTNKEQHGGLFIRVASVLQTLGLLSFLAKLGFYNPLIYVITKN